MPAGLSVVATPIGNAADIGLRALDTLRRANLVICEDTRVTAKLLRHHGISARTLAYHEHNAEKMRPKVMQHLKGGETVALVSDAGTPLVSDPGYKLVRACLDEGIPVTAVPGASSVMTALVLSGLPSDRFLFTGFLPSKAGARREALAEIADIRATLVLMESPKRLAASLADMAKVLGTERDAAVTRELTKLYEEVRRGPLADLAAHYADAGAPKGEVVVVVGPPEADASTVDDTTVDRLLREALVQMSVRDAAAAVAVETGRARRDVYGRALKLARDSS